MAKQFIDEKVIVELFSKGNKETKAIILKTFPFLDVEGMVDKKEAEAAKLKSTLANEIPLADGSHVSIAIAQVTDSCRYMIDDNLNDICRELGITEGSVQLGNGAVLDQALKNRSIYLSEMYDWKLFKGIGDSRILVPFLR